MSFELLARFNAVKKDISNALDLAQRKNEEVKLIAVSKTHPANMIRTLVQEGQYEFGENYVQEWLGKVEELKDLPIIWHVIGPIQSNKTQDVAEHAHWLHTLDRLKIAQRLNEQRPPVLPPLNVCIQVNVSGEATKSGLLPEAVLDFALKVNQMPNLCLRGLMCLPENTDNVDDLSHQFILMQQLLRSLQQQGLNVDVLSMGMSADMALAIKYGATYIRIGSAIFGERKKSV